MAGEDVDFGSARITIDIDDGNADSESRATGARIQRALLQATRRVGEQMRRQIQRGLNAAAVTVRVEPDLSRFDAQLLAGLRSLDSIDIPVAPDVTGFVERLRALLAGVEIPIRVVPDLSDFDARIRAHRPPPVTVPVNVDSDRLTRALSGLGRVAAGVGGAVAGVLRIGALGIAAVGAAAGVAQLVAALAPAAGLLAALPAVVLGFQAALGTLKFALAGVSDAFQSALTGDAKQFEKSLENLSPKAQAAAREVRAMKPAFEELRDSVQDAFFTQIEGQITATAKALRGPMLAGLTNISSAWGNAAKGVLGYVQGAQGVANIRSILGGAEQAVVGLSQTTNKLTAGLLQVAAVVADRFGAELSGGIANLGDRFGEWLQKIAQGGQAVAWVDNALNTLAQLGDLAGNIGDIFQGVWGAAGAAGAGFLGRLQTITQSVADFVNSTAGQSALGNIFTFLGRVAQQVGPIIGALVTQLGGIAPQLAPLLQIGPLLVQVINGLGTAVQGALPHLTVAFANVQTVVTSLLPALPPLAAAFAALVRSASDLLVPLAPVATLLAQIIGPIVDLAAPVLVAAAATFGLVKAIAAVRAAIALLQASWLALNAAFVANPIGVIIVAVIGLVTAIYLLYQRFGIVRTVVDAVGRALRDGFLAAVEFVKSAALGIADFFVSAFQTARSAVSTGIDAVVSFFTGLPGRIVAGVSALGSTISNFFVSSFEFMKVAVQAGITALVDFFVQLPGRIVAGLAALPGLLIGAFTSAVAFVIIGLLTVIAGIVFVFTELPGRIYNALVSLGSFLINAFVVGFNAVTSTLSGWISSTVSFFQQLPGRVYNALVSLGSFLINAFVVGFNAVTSTLSGWISSTVSFFRQLPGRALAALSSLGSSLLRAFVTAFNSAKSATTSGISAVVGFFRALPGRIGSALAALPGKISSAFTSAAGAARRAVSSLISGVVGLFSSLGSKIVGAMGDIGSQIVSKVKSGLPSAVRKYLPFAKGGIVYGPTHALIGEAGPEVVIPLTKPKRAMALAARSGLLGILGMQHANTLAAANSGSAAAVSSGVADLRKALSGIAALLDNVGAEVVHGMVEGIRSNSGALVTAATNLADSAVTAAKDTLGIASPSKVFRKIGTDVGRGFIDGLTGTSAKIKATTEKLAKDIIAAFAGKKTRLDDRLVALVDAGNKRLQSLAAQRDALTQRIADAQKFAADTTKKALDAFSLANLTQGTDQVTAKSLTVGLEAAVARVRTFSAQLSSLAKRGLSKDLLAQIVGLGPDQGAAIAAALASSTKDSLKRLNSLQSQLAKASGTLGTTSADVLFDAGKNAGAGFLAGLKGQCKSIEKLMLDIAKGMQAAIRTALRIKSPSRVMMRIGDMTGAGLQVGLVGRIPAIAAASRAAAQAMVRAVSSQLSDMPDLAPSLGGGQVVPLTRSQRLRQAADGATPAGPGRARNGGNVVHNHTWNIREVGDGRVTAERVVNRFVLAAGVGA